MIYILFFTVFAITVIDFFLFGCDILSPSMWTGIMFLISIFVNLLNINRWGTDYSIRAFVYIIIGLLSMVFGEYMAKNFRNIFYINQAKANYTKSKNYNSYHLDHITAILALILSISCLIIDIHIVSSVTGYNQIFSSLKYMRSLLADGIFKKGFIGRIVFTLNKSICFIEIYILLYNRILRKVKNQIINFFPIVLFFVEAILTTGRVEFIRIITYSFFVLIQFYNRDNKDIVKRIIKIFLVGLCAIIFFAIIFTIAGKIIGKGRHNAAIDVLYYYSGSSIYLFNKYISETNSAPNEYFGEHTLYGVYNILHYIFPAIKHISNPALEMHYIPNWYSNVYTAFRRYYQDFGLAGIIIILMFLGFFYASLELAANRERNQGWMCIFYAYSIYPIIEIAIEERFLINYLSFSNAFQIAVLYIVHMFITKIRFK